MMELKASRSRDAEAVVVEARMDRGQGPIATVRALEKLSASCYCLRQSRTLARP